MRCGRKRELIDKALKPRKVREPHTVGGSLLDQSRLLKLHERTGQFVHIGAQPARYGSTRKLIPNQARIATLKAVLPREGDEQSSDAFDEAALAVDELVAAVIELPLEGLGVAVKGALVAVQDLV
jgi:hypothetical protein